MFTGIVEATGRVVEATPTSFGKRLVVDRTGWDVPAKLILPGGSVCVNGVCLTIVHNNNYQLIFDVISETLRSTTLGMLKAGSRVNLEASLTAGKPLAGHFVQGHVETVGQVLAVAQGENDRRITIGPIANQQSQIIFDKEFMQSIVPKGSVTVDGVSLTVAAVVETHHAFEVALIPTTLRCTTLGDLCVGDPVNLESDILARTVVYWLQHFGQPGSRSSDVG